MTSQEQSRSVGAAIRAWREAEGYSQAEAAAFANVTAGTFSGWERDLHLPAPRQVRILRNLGVDIPEEPPKVDVELRDRVAAVERALTGLLAVLRADEPAASRRLKVDAIAAALGVEEPPRGGRGSRPPRSARGSS